MKLVLLGARELLPPCLQGYPHLSEGGHNAIVFVYFAKYNLKILLCHQSETPPFGRRFVLMGKRSVIIDTALSVNSSFVTKGCIERDD